MESALAQTWTDFRLVVSDNASTDDTPAVVARFDDPRLVYARLDGHLELYEHLNLCFARAETEYFFILSDDDRITPDFLERTVAALDRNPSAGLAHTQVTVVDPHGGVIAEGHSMTGLAEDTVETGAEFITRTMEMGHRVYTAASLYRTEAVSPTRLEDVPITDVGQCLRTALDWDMSFVAQPLCRYLLHTSAQTAASADVDEGGAVHTHDGILKTHEIKLRFISEYADRLKDPDDLRRRAERRLRQALVARAAHETLPERRLGPTLKALLGAGRLERRVMFEPAGWRLLAGSVLGPRGVSVVKRAVART